MPKDEGYIKLYRSLLNWEWIDKPETLSTFLFLILSANHSDKEWHGTTIKRGQTVTSYNEICTKLGLTVAQVRTSIKRLISTGEITHQKTNRYSLITIRNYDAFQGVNNTQIDSQSTVNQQSINSQSTTNKNEKNKKNDKKYIYAQKNEFFDAFWCAYPKKKNKIRAREVFDNINITEEILNQMIVAIENQKNTEEWQKENGRYIPYPESWLKYHRWEDEVFTTALKETSFDVKKVRTNIDFGSMKNKRRRSK